MKVHYTYSKPCFNAEKSLTTEVVRLVFALPIFPGSRPPSIVGADELNFCVRDGNRWTLIAINTNSLWVAFNHLLYQKPNGFGCQLIVAYAEPLVNKNLSTSFLHSNQSAMDSWCTFRDSNPGPTD